MVRLCRAWQARQGRAGRGMAGYCLAGMVCHGLAGMVCLGEQRYVELCLGMLRYGLERQAWFGMVC